MLEDILMKWGGIEETALTVYSDIFSFGEHQIQCENEEPGLYKANPIAYWRNGSGKGHYRIVFEDTFDKVLPELQKADFAIINGLTYFGRKNVQEHASKMYAMILDIDGVTDRSLNAFLNGAFIGDAYPIPNYIILSGHGVHLYYIFDEPISLYPNIKLQLKALKYGLIDKIWNMYTSDDRKKQYQGINQGFRVIGGKSKIDGVCVRAFRLNHHPVTLDQLNRYVPEENQIDIKKIWRERKMSLAEAKEKYPFWYQSRVIEKQPRKYWTCKPDLYNWWLRKIKEGATYRHRYFSIMCLAIYAVKCGVSFEKVRGDAFNLIPFLDSIYPDEPFTENDCLSALECYDIAYCTFPIDDIVKISGIDIIKNKRNGRTRQQQMKIVNATNLVKREMGEHIGRPSMDQLVMDYIRLHPGDNVTQISKALSVSRPTVYKYKKMIEKNKGD